MADMIDEPLMGLQIPPEIRTAVIFPIAQQDEGSRSQNECFVLVRDGSKQAFISIDALIGAGGKVGDPIPAKIAKSLRIRGKEVKIAVLGEPKTGASLGCNVCGRLDWHELYCYWSDWNKGRRRRGQDPDCGPPA